MGSHVNRPKQCNLQSVDVKNQINFCVMKRFTLTYIEGSELAQRSFCFGNRYSSFSFYVLLPQSMLSFFLFCSDSTFLAFFFQFIYHFLCSILTIHVQVGFWEFLSVPSSTSWNFLWAAVRLPPYCSGITSTLMRSESWLRGN